MSSRALLRAWSSVLLVALLSGCSSAAEDEAAESDSLEFGRFTCSEQCVRSGVDECQRLCSDCWDTCGVAAARSGVSCAGVCTSVCDCTPAQEQSCSSYEYACDAGEADPAVEVACMKWSQALGECDRVPLFDCSDMASVLKEDAPPT